MLFGGGLWLYHKFGHAFWTWSTAPAFFLYALGMTVNMYGYFWMNLLFGVDRVKLGQQIFAFGLVLNYVLCVAGIILGAGLYALAVGQIALALVPRFIAREIFSREFLNGAVETQKVEWRDLWPMTWRSGLGSFGTYLGLPAMTLVCAQFCGLADTAKYGISLQLALMLHALSATWMSVLWPRLGAMRTRREFPQMIQLIISRMGLSLGTYALVAMVAWALAPQVLHQFRSKTDFLPPSILATLLLVVGVDMLVGLFNAILLTGNKIPQLGASLINGFLAIAFAVLLVKNMGILGIVLAPLCAQGCFNLWFSAWLCRKDLKSEMNQV
jgi:O-antigen/teichoic acid export membrane protein